MRQGTEEWFQARLGNITASRIGDLMAKTKSGPSASRRNYIMQLLCERLTGTWTEGFQSKEMLRGIELEPFAQATYEFISGRDIDSVGYIPHPAINGTGASPDGLIDWDGMIEVKCPNTANHIDTMLRKTIDRRYILQMQWQMCCAGRLWCDFVSFDDRLPDDLRLCILRVDRDEKLIKEITDEVLKGLAELDELERKLRFS